jgi:hypothetical protein
MITTVMNKLRDLLEDGYTSGSTFRQYTTSLVFTMQDANIDSTSIVVYKNGTLVASSNYSISSISPIKVTYTGTISSGDLLEFDYNKYLKYSDNEVKGYIRSALVYLSIEKYQTFVLKSDDTIFPTPTEAQENLIALIGNILARGSIRVYKTPEISIDFVEKQSKEEKIKYAIRQFSKTFGTVKYIKTDRDVTLDPEDNK